MRNAENEVNVGETQHASNLIEPNANNSLIRENHDVINVEENNFLIAEEGRVNMPEGLYNQQTGNINMNAMEFQLNNENNRVIIKARQVKYFLRDFLPSFLNVRLA